MEWAGKEDGMNVTEFIAEVRKSLTPEENEEVCDDCIEIVAAKSVGANPAQVAELLRAESELA
jgi:hypothetical protein